MKVFAILACLAATALAVPAPAALPAGTVATSPEIRALLKERQVDCQCIGGEYCCEYECSKDPSC